MNFSIVYVDADELKILGMKKQQKSKRRGKSETKRKKEEDEQQWRRLTQIT